MFPSVQLVSFSIPCFSPLRPLVQTGFVLQYHQILCLTGGGRLREVVAMRELTVLSQT